MNGILQDDRRCAGTGRPTPSPAWGLLSQSLTGYDWHGGYYAAPARPRRNGAVRGIAGWLHARRAARELERLSASERADARLPTPAGPRVSRETLAQRVASWAAARTPGDPCPDGGC